MLIRTLETIFPDARLFAPEVYEDHRGQLMEAYDHDIYAALGVKETFVQDLVTWSEKHVLRGLHYDMRMAKFVQVLRGRVYDVIVDMRPESETYKKWQGFFLSSDNHYQLYIPKGFAHGFMTLTDAVVFHYKMSVHWSLEHELRLNWRDPSVGIDWRVVGPVIASEKDA
ncbi:MAG: dTDP-4-dehydrorhamnose 3,5-epimerase [Candidatus Eremiobacteraeota bacterium]|nr:dTDP-4-dehydrorhamnose 3,5-epimerase [Candidatus Eremiobacteraeota bacterium]